MPSVLEKTLGLPELQGLSSFHAYHPEGFSLFLAKDPLETMKEISVGRSVGNRFCGFELGFVSVLWVS